MDQIERIFVFPHFSRNEEGLFQEWKEALKIVQDWIRDSEQEYSTKLFPKESYF